MEPAGSEQQVVVPTGPGGEPLTGGRRLTCRRARSWAKRSDVPLGRMPCGGPVEWVGGEQRRVAVLELRRAEGKDCNPAGDVLLFRLADGGSVLVIDEHCGTSFR